MKGKDGEHKLDSIDLEQYREGMPCHRYILRNLRDKKEALTFVKTFVNTMTSVHLPDEYIEADIYMFSHHLPPSSPLGRHSFEEWPTFIDDIPLVEAIRMDNSVGTYKRCTQFYKSITSKTDACKICPLSKNYLNAKEKEELSVLRFLLESEENYNYIMSLGIQKEVFVSSVDMLEIVTGSLSPGIYPFCYKVLKSLEVPRIYQSHFAMKHKSKMSPAMSQYLTTDLLKKTIPEQHSNPAYVSSMISVVWDYIQNHPLKTATEIYKEVEVLTGHKASTGTDDRNKNVITSFSDLGPSYVNDFYNSNFNENDTKEHKSVSKKSVRLENVSFDSIFSSLCEEPLSDNLDTAGYDISSEPSPAAESVDAVCLDENERQVNEVELMGNSSLSDEGTLTIGTDMLLAVAGTECGDFSKVQETACQEDNMNSCGEITIHEVSSQMYITEIFPDKNSMVSIPFVSELELMHFAIALDNAPVRLHTIFESHVIKDKRLCIEMVETDNGIRLLLMYSPKLHAYFYTGLKDTGVVSFMTNILSYPSIQKYCYYPFWLVSSLAKEGMRVKGLCSLFTISAILYDRHRMTMEESLLKMGAWKATGGVTIKPEGEIESIALLLMHSYPSVYHRNLSRVKRCGLYGEYEGRLSFDMLLSEHFQQGMYSCCNRVLFSLADSSRLIFGNERDESYRLEGRVYRYTLRGCQKPSYVLRKLLCKLRDNGSIYKYDVMLTSLSLTTFTIFIANKDIVRYQTIINTTLLLLLLDEEYKNVTYDITEVT